VHGAESVVKMKLTEVLIELFPWEQANIEDPRRTLA
jgi:hypothetical protein